MSDMSDETLLQTVFHDWHVENGGRMVEFGGWHMPVQYSTIVEEHNVVRSTVGLFDIAHMGRLLFTGADDCRFLDHLLTNDIARLKTGQVRYSLVTREDGGVLDDVLVYRLADSYMLVVNASNRVKVLDWLMAHCEPFDVQIQDQTSTHAMVAVQGPKSAETVEAIGIISAGSMKYYSSMEADLAGTTALVSRTGYTGEDGFEVIVPVEAGQQLWDQLLQAGKPLGLQACGLGCRDTLRLEAAMPLYGHELSESIDPITAGLKFAVKLEAADFIGKEALAAIAESGPKQIRAGLELEGRRIAREGARIMNEDAGVGEVTSGTFSPTLQKSIAMGYVDRDCFTLGRELEIDIRGKRHAARIVDLPFYRREEQ